MNNLQLLLSIGIPTLAVIVSMVLNNGRFNAIEGRFNAIDGRFNAVEARLITIEGDLRRFYQDLGKLQGHVEGLERK